MQIVDKTFSKHCLTSVLIVVSCVEKAITRMRVLVILFAAVAVALSGSASGEIINVPQDNCFWRGARYGAMTYCEMNEIAVGSCGSGLNDDCDNGIQLLSF